MLETVEVPVAVEEDCGACAERLRAGLAAHRGIASVEAHGAGDRLLVRFDPDLCSLECLSDQAGRLRLDFSERFAHRVVRVAGMDCAGCAQTIERAVKTMPGVSGVSVNFAAARMRLEYDPRAVELDAIEGTVEGLGYRVVRPGAKVAAPAAWWRRRELFTAVSLLALLAGVALDLAGAAPVAVDVVYGVAIAIGGLPLARHGIAALRATHHPDINLLMAVAAIGASAIGAWLEAALVVVLFSIGELLEGRAVERARRELAGLVALTPESARVLRVQPTGLGTIQSEVELPLAEVALDDLVVVRPGERIPVDGLVEDGRSAVDQAPITGEATPVDKAPGDPVFAGTVNRQGLLVVRTGAPPGDATVDRIARLVAEAQARKSPSERWVDAFARVYTPAVIGVAVLVATIPTAFGVDFSSSLYAALALLIIACPCALVISTPVAIVSALGRASSAGVLVKGGAHLERAATIRQVAFDKTGTLTTGRPRVTTVEPFEGTEEELLALAASVEHGSEHPLAAAVVDAANDRGLALSHVESFEALTGLGARGTVGGAEVLVGSDRLLAELPGLDAVAAGAIDRLRERGESAVLVARGGRIVGALGLADRPRPEAAEAVADLRRLGIDRVLLLTGDHPRTAAAVAAAVGIDDVRAELLPGDKAAALDGLEQVAMVGDGVNDAPALAASRLGIAMGSAGSDTAIEVADVALMGDDPRKVAGLIGLARWTKAIVRQNIGFSLATKLLAVAILAAGALPLWGAVVADVGASLLVVANGLRLLRTTPRGPMRTAPLLAAPPLRGRRRDRMETVPG